MRGERHHVLRSGELGLCRIELRGGRHVGGVERGEGKTNVNVPALADKIDTLLHTLLHTLRVVSMSQLLRTKYARAYMAKSGSPIPRIITFSEFRFV